ncbi:hypothetical protein ACS6Z0_07350 [Streptococcus suis]
MLKLMYADYFKMWKNKSLLSILTMSVVPLIFSIIVSMDLESMKMADGAFNLLSFPQSMWQFVFGTSLPILILSYLSSSLGRELKAGNLIYQVTRVADRNKIVYAKLWTILSLNLLYFITFHSVGFISYLIFINGTRFAGNVVFDLATSQEFLLTVFTFLLQFVFCILAFLLSFKVSTIGLVIFSFVGTTLLSLLSSIDLIRNFVPGSVFYAPQLFADGQFEKVMFGQSMGLLLMTILLVVCSKRLFVRASV